MVYSQTSLELFGRSESAKTLKMLTSPWIGAHSTSDTPTITSIQALEGWAFGTNFDSVSSWLIFLTVTIFPLCFLYVSKREDRHMWALYLLGTELLIILAFTVADILAFFIIFDILIFPMYKFIVSLGSSGQPRLTAARSFIMYTVFGSLLLLFVIVNIFTIFQTTDFAVLWIGRNLIPEHLVLPLFIAFAAKVPTFPFYHWLTLAHVEASTVGSVILAALILKLGGYGFIRFLIPLFSETQLYKEAFKLYL